MDRLIKVLEGFNKNFTIFFVLFFTGLFAFFAYDIIKNPLGSFPLEDIYHTGSEMAGAAVVFAIIAISYYFLRILFVQLKKKKSNINPVTEKTLKYTVAILKNLHPFFGSIAVGMLMMHAYLIFYKVLSFRFTIITITGLTTFIVLMIMAFFGIILHYKRQNKTIRNAHKFIAFIMVAAFLVHRILVLVLIG